MSINKLDIYKNKRYTINNSKTNFAHAAVRKLQQM